MLWIKSLFGSFADADLTDLIAFRNCLAQFKTELGKGTDNAAVAVHSDIAQCSDLILRDAQLFPGIDKRAIVEIDIQVFICLLYTSDAADEL